jgi:hypothetical protein
VLPLTVTKRGARQTVPRASIDQAINPTSTIAVETHPRPHRKDGLMPSARAAWTATANLSTRPAIVTATILGEAGTRLTVEQRS